MNKPMFFAQNVQSFRSTPGITDILVSGNYNRSFSLCKVRELDGIRQLIYNYIYQYGTTVILYSVVITLSGGGLVFSTATSFVEDSTFEYLFSTTMLDTGWTSPTTGAGRYIAVGSKQVGSNRNTMISFWDYAANSGDNDAVNYVSSLLTDTNNYHWATADKLVDSSFALVVVLYGISSFGMKMFKVYEYLNTPSITDTTIISTTWGVRPRYFPSVTQLSQSIAIVAYIVVTYSSTYFCIEVINVMTGINILSDTTIDSWSSSGTVGDYVVKTLRMSSSTFFLVRTKDDGIQYYAEMYRVNSSNVAVNYSSFLVDTNVKCDVISSTRQYSGIKMAFNGVSKIVLLFNTLSSGQEDSYADLRYAVVNVYVDSFGDWRIRSVDSEVVINSCYIDRDDFDIKFISQNDAVIVHNMWSTPSANFRILSL